MASKKYDKPIRVEPNIYKYGDNLFRVIVRKGSGKDTILLSEYVDGRITDARKKKTQLLTEIDKLDKNKVEKGKTTFFDFSKTFIDFCRNEGLSPATITGYKQRLNMVMPELGDIALNDIDTFTLQKVITNLKNTNKSTQNDDGTVSKISTTTVNGVYRTIRNVLNRAFDWEYIDANPLLRVKTPPIAKVEKSSYNKQELYDIIKKLYTINKKRGAMYILVMCTGIRRSELLGLHLNDLTLDKGTIIINDQERTKGKIFINRSAVWDDEKKMMVEVPTKTPKSKRGIPIPPFCVEVLKDFLESYRKREVLLLKEKHNKDIKIVNNVFLGISGGIMHCDSISTGWKRIVKKFDLKNVSLHGLRHSYNSLQRNNNFNLSDREVADLLGHSNLQMNDHYTHTNRDIENDALSIWDDFENTEDLEKEL